MSRRFWIHITAPVGTLLILGVMLVAVTVTSPLERSNPVRPVQSETITASDTRDDPAQTRSIDERAQADLEAQQRMARWAFWMFVASAGSVFVATVAVILVYRTLREATKTTRVAEQTADITWQLGKTQLRAYIYPASPTVSLAYNGVVSATVPFENSGQTPAKRFKAWASISVLEHPHRGVLATVPPIELSESPVRPRGKAVLKTKTTNVSDEDRTAIEDASKAIYLNGSAEYIDVFDNKQTLDFRYMYYGPWGGTKPMMVCPDGNKDT